MADARQGEVALGKERLVERERAHHREERGVHVGAHLRRDVCVRARLTREVAPLVPVDAVLRPEHVGHAVSYGTH